MSSSDTSARPRAHAPAPVAAAPEPPPPLHPLEDLLAAPRVAPRRPGRWISALVLLVLAAMLVHSSILRGLELTLWLTAAVMVTGYLLGIGVAAMRLSGNPVLAPLGFGFVWLLRSVPPLVQLLFWYELASLYPRLSLGIPFGHEFVTVRTAHLFSGVLAAYVGLSLDVTAFSSEIVRGGLLSVERGQTEAAQALGLGRTRIFRRMVTCRRTLATSAPGPSSPRSCDAHDLPSTWPLHANERLSRDDPRAARAPRAHLAPLSAQRRRVRRRARPRPAQRLRLRHVHERHPPRGGGPRRRCRSEALHPGRRLPDHGRPGPARRAAAGRPHPTGTLLLGTSPAIGTSGFAKRSVPETRVSRSVVNPTATL